MPIVYVSLIIKEVIVIIVFGLFSDKTIHEEHEYKKDKKNRDDQRYLIQSDIGTFYGVFLKIEKVKEEYCKGKKKREFA
jgi:uncharacterized membrane protein YjgN (DUF898 family)